MPTRVKGELKLNLEDFPDALKTKFIKDLEGNPTLYLLKFGDKQEGKAKSLKLLRGASVTGIKSQIGCNPNEVTVEV